MRHVILTCKNHPHLRWSCKDIAFSDHYGYNGVRSIFFLGEPTGNGGYQTHFNEREKPAVRECSCPPTDLIRAPEDKLAGQS